VKKVMVGTVVSDKMDKTIVVETERLMRHPVYNRTMKRRAKFKAHDEKNEARTGDRVKIVECRPLSRSKRWRLLEVVEKAREE
jgi:small subunit ribosomal protein S17